ncbi:hypothetical protein ACHQM5_005185 [Ranunculus cassubicifolius]
MTLTPTLSFHPSPSLTLPITSSLKPWKDPPQKALPSYTLTNRRVATIASINTLLLAKDTIFNTETASSFDFRITVPDQTPQEAADVLKEHAEDLLDVRPLLESKLWRDAQKALRKSAALLKQDVYTLIQAKPGSERQQLRVLYSQLFNAVTRLDYAARDQNVDLCKELFDRIIVSLDSLLSLI